MGEAKRRREHGLPQRRRLLGSWTLPSGNNCHAYLGPEARLSLEWDEPPSPAWSTEDLAHYERVTFPEILRAVATATGQRVLGARLE